MKSGVRGGRGPMARRSALVRLGLIALVITVSLGCMAAATERVPPFRTKAFGAGLETDTAGPRVGVLDVEGRPLGALRWTSQSARFYDETGLRSGRLQLVPHGFAVSDSARERVCTLGRTPDLSTWFVACIGFAPVLVERGAGIARLEIEGREVLRVDCAGPFPTVGSDALSARGCLVHHEGHARILEIDEEAYVWGDPGARDARRSTDGAPRRMDPMTAGIVLAPLWEDDPAASGFLVRGSVAWIIQRAAASNEAETP